MVLEWGNTSFAADYTNKCQGHDLVQTSSSRMSTVRDSPLEINWPEVMMAMVESLIIEGAIGGKIGLNPIQFGGGAQSSAQTFRRQNGGF